MGLTKQAKALSDKQIKNALARMGDYRFSLRNRAILELTYLAGLRAKEVASLRWGMVLNAEGQVGDAITLTNDATKGKSGGIVYLNGTLKGTLEALLNASGGVSARDAVVQSGKGGAMRTQSVVNLLWKHYRLCDIDGASSHSGRRTFITNAARKISLVGGSMRDVQCLARHSNLQTTQRYVEQNSEAQKRVVQLVG